MEASSPWSHRAYREDTDEGVGVAECHVVTGKSPCSPDRHLIRKSGGVRALLTSSARLGTGFSPLSSAILGASYCPFAPPKFHKHPLDT